MVNHNISSELVVEIFLKLPVKSLCRFKCLSKSYKSLINDPWFVKTHLATTNKQRLVRCYFGLRYLDLEQSCDHPKFVKLKLNFGIKPMPHIEDSIFDKRLSSSKSLSVYGSCNGLLCVSRAFRGEDNFFLCNPSTRECKIIPKVVEPIDFSEVLYGFGYAGAIDDYLFVQASWDERVANLFSLKNNVWKRVKVDSSSCVYFEASGSHPGIPLNGAIHWEIADFLHPSRKSWVIAAFDLVEEKFITLPLPNDVNTRADQIYSSELSVMRNCLCMLCEYIHYEFWIVNEYGIQESWTRMIIIDPLSSPIRTLCLGKNTDSIMMVFYDSDGEKLFIYDPKENKFKDFVVRGLKQDYILNKITLQVYVESLVSLNPMN